MPTNEEIAARIQAGENDLLGDLWEAVERFVRACANKYGRRYGLSGGAEVEDLYQSGYFAMCVAIRSYKPEKGLFLTWLGVHLKSAFAAVCGRRTNREQNDPIQSACSLDAPIDGGEVLLYETIPSDDGGIAEAQERIEQQELRTAIEDFLDGLSVSDGELLRERYIDGRTAAEMAVKRGKSIRAVNSAVQLARIRAGQSAAAHRLARFLDFDPYRSTGWRSFRDSGTTVQERYLLRQEERAGLGSFCHKRAHL